MTCPPPDCNQRQTMGNTGRASVFFKHQSSTRPFPLLSWVSLGKKGNVSLLRQARPRDWKVTTLLPFCWAFKGEKKKGDIKSATGITYFPFVLFKNLS